MDNSYLQHYGIKGQKWGVRRFQDKSGRLTSAGKKRYNESYSFTTKRGEKLSLERYETPKLTRALAKVSPKVRTNVDNTYHYKLKNSKGKVVGDYQLHKDSPDEMNMVWGSVDQKYQGRGYMTAMMKQGELIAKKYGATKMTGEVVGNSPDMLHIAEKAGYVKLGEVRTQEVLDMWGGLTLIEKKL